ncbi:MAG: DUF896 domain-containing protein [Clostridia bacterium]|nr:DUF896 domain-containing protein [Clostridia bacterium]
MTEKEIERINELSRKKQAGTLTPEEAEERAALHAAYIKAIRKNIRIQLGTYKEEDF